MTIPAISHLIFHLIGLSYFDPSRLVRLVSEFGRLEDGHAAPLSSPTCRLRRQVGEERGHGFCSSPPDFFTVLTSWTGSLRRSKTAQLIFYLIFLRLEGSGKEIM